MLIAALLNIPHSQHSLLAWMETSISCFHEWYFGLPSLSWTHVVVAVPPFFILSEIVFYIYFQRCVVPRANIVLNGTNEPTEPYYDYPHLEDRVNHCRRIFSRLEKKAQRKAQRDNSCPKTTFQQVVREFVVDWFDKIDPANGVKAEQDVTLAMLHTKQSAVGLRELPPLASSIVSEGDDCSSCCSLLTEEIGEGTTESHNTLNKPNTCADNNDESPKDDSDQRSRHSLWTIPGLYYDESYTFFAWGFLGKDSRYLTKPEHSALIECLECITEITGLDFPKAADDGSQPSMYKPRRMTLEQISNTKHRPWVSYALVSICQQLARSIILPFMGFEKVTTRIKSVEMRAWYRRPTSPPEAASSNVEEVALFFHGLAPAGLLGYLPMVRSILPARQHQHVLLFENAAVSFQYHHLPQFEALNEPDTVESVLDILRQLKLTESQHRLTLIGHSFGSTWISWMLRRSMLFPKIDHVVLLDPITLLMSEPFAVVQFLYSGGSNMLSSASSDLFNQYVLRRYLCWYNSECNLEDYVDQDGGPEKWTIVLSGNDALVPSDSVAEYVSSFGLSEKKCNLVYWPEAYHGECVLSPKRWSEIGSYLRR